MTPARAIDTSGEILFAEAEKLGLQPTWENAVGLLSIVINGKKEFLFHTKLHINSRLGAWISQNKSSSHIVLGYHGLPMIPYCEPVTRAELQNFLKKYKRIIKKPLVGSQSEGVELITKTSELPQSPFEKLLFEQYIEGSEYRYLVFKGKVLAVRKKELKKPGIDFNDVIITILDASEWEIKLANMAVKIAEILSLGFMAVDYLIDKNGKAYILETNSSPSLYYFHFPNYGAPQNIARVLLEELYIGIDGSSIA